MAYPGAVFAQQELYWEGRGDTRSPRTILFLQLVAQLKAWKEAGEELVLMGDFNEHIYTGRWAKRLAEPDLNMAEQCRRATGRDVPATHERGSTPLMGIFATTGVETTGVAILPRKSGVGDHLVFLIDCTSDSILGNKFPKVVRPGARNLHCNSERIVRAYTSDLKRLLREHRMFSKLNNILQTLEWISTNDFQWMMDRWDDELTDYMLSAEASCSKFQMCHIEWSPHVGVWLTRRWLLQRVARFLEGLVPDPRNLIRDCKTKQICDPRVITREQLAVEILVCREQLKELSKQAPQLRREHLQDCLSDAQSKDDEDRAAAILRIMHVEKNKAQWRRVNASTKKPRGNAVFLVRVKLPDESVEEFGSKEDVFLRVSSHLSERFRRAFTAPIMKGKLFDDVGFLGNTEAVIRILEGTYEFPSNCCPATRLLCEEAHHTYASLSKEQVANYVTGEDFSSYWKTANERISSSVSKLHFGHYKAASSDQSLSTLHAAKLSACARKGVPLSRWGHGLTVLLEKIFGNNYVHRLRAICLFEADFNWLNKLIFAKRMMDNAAAHELIPIENFAKKGSRSIGAVMVKTLFSDDSKIMHHPTAIVGCDFSDCYDRVAHPMQSIAFQAWGVNAKSVKVMLTCLQVMQFCLRTGFGESKETFGGSPEEPLMGLGQGNTAGPSGFSCTSSLAVNAYRRQGNGARLTSAYMMRVFLLAAAMYVDDTDLLFRALNADEDDEAMIEHTQEGVTRWGLLGQAIGGALKRDKCYAYLYFYRFVRGKAFLKRRRHFPAPSEHFVLADGTAAVGHVHIPQPDGSAVYIPTRDMDEAEKMLGVHFKPLGTGEEHMTAMCKKGYDWADRLDTKPLDPRDAWFSFQFQLMKGAEYGLVAVTLPPKELEKHVQRMYFRVLPKLGVNRNIGKEWRTLPTRYHGLAMPNFTTMALGSKLGFLLAHWGNKSAEGRMAMHCFESFLMELGLYHNPLAHDFGTFGHLATEGTWFHHLWRLVDLVQVKVDLHPDWHIKPVREGDKSLVAAAFQQGVAGDDLQRFNIVCHYKEVMHLSDIACCDGKSLDTSILGRGKAPSSKHIFPLERPRRKDFALFERVVRRLPLDMGPFIIEPHRPASWVVSICGRLVYSSRQRGAQAYHDIFECDESARPTRAGALYRWMATGTGEAPLGRYATVYPVNESMVRLHSTALPPSPPNEPESFWHRLYHLGGTGFWERFHCNDDGKWIARGLSAGSLLLAHDGSYQEKLDSQVCSGAFVIKCALTGKKAKGVWVERSPMADNYRGEFLGAMALQLVLRAATQGVPSVYPLVHIDCDNSGVVGHGNSPTRSLPEKQAQADCLRCLRKYVTTNPFRTKFCWIKGHVDKEKSYEECSPREQANIEADDLADKGLRAALQTGEYIPSSFPLEDICVTTSEGKVGSSMAKAFDLHQGKPIARALFHRKGIVDCDDFDLIWWEGLEKVQVGWATMLRVFLTKHVADCSGTNNQLHRWDATHDTIVAHAARQPWRRRSI